MRHIKLIGIGLAVAFLFAGCAAKEAPEQTPTVTVQVGAAENEQIQRRVIAQAVLYPIDQAAIVPKIVAPVKKFYVDRGSHVHVGEVLAELENQDLTGAYTDSQGSYEQSEAAYQAQLQKSQQDLNLAKEELNGAQKVYDSRVALYKQGAVSAKDVDDSRVSLTQASDQYEAAQKQYDLKAAEGQLMSAKGKSASAEAQLSYSKIVSPINGVVTDRPYYSGETAPSGTPILTVMNLSQVVARAHISQQDAIGLKFGDPATIMAPSLTMPIKGKVTFVGATLDPSSTTVEVWIQAPNPNEQLRAGSSVSVGIVAQTVPHAIVIPAASLLTATDGVTSVMVLDSDNKPHRAKVKVGIRDGDNVQVTDGLKGGERVVTVGAFELDQLDPDVLPKVTIQVQAPKMPEEDDDEDDQ